jgi:serine/threonine-protein phosphatase 2A regulatory subunit B'
LDRVHSIFQTLLTEPAPLAHSISPTFLSQLITELDTPVREEQSQIEAEICCILNAFPNLIPIAIRRLVFMLDEFREGCRSASCVSAVLTILLKHFDKSWPEPSDGVYRRSIVPLYMTDFLSDFERPLRTITGHFIARDPENAEVCLLKLLRNWPRTNARKEIAFLRQFSLLLSRVRDDALVAVCPLVLKAIAECIRSANSSVAKSACFLLSDGQFMWLFTSVRDMVARTLVPALRVATAQWAGDARQMAREILKALGDDGAMMWEAVAQSAETWKRLAEETGIGLAARLF